MISPAMQRCLLVQLVMQADLEDLPELTERALELRRARAHVRFLRVVKGLDIHDN